MITRKAQGIPARSSILKLHALLRYRFDENPNTNQRAIMRYIEKEVYLTSRYIPRYYIGWKIFVDIQLFVLKTALG